MRGRASAGRRPPDGGARAPEEKYPDRPSSWDNRCISLSNNIAERALKKAILHRRNALFYKTENGADVGDVFMTLVHTTELSGMNPFDYLTELLRHPREVADNADAWLPWNYRRTVELLQRTLAG